MIIHMRRLLIGILFVTGLFQLPSTAFGQTDSIHIVVYSAADENDTLIYKYHEMIESEIMALIGRNIPSS